MSVLHIRMTCTKCGKKFRRSVSNIQKTSLCVSCRYEEKYGEKRNLEKVKEANDKRKQTTLLKYGVDNVAKSKYIQEKWCNTKLKKYGHRGRFEDSKCQQQAEKLAHSKEAYLKKRKTCTDRYGVDNYMKNEDNRKEWVKKTRQKTGYDNPMQNPKVKQKIIDTYGRIGRVKGYVYKDIHFDSSWELAYYIWLIDNNKDFIYHPSFSFTYLGDDEKEHDYYPDFLVEGKFYEIKGTQFFNEREEPYNMYTKNFWWNKYNLMKKHGVIILKKSDIQVYLKYIENTYGKKYLKQFKIEKFL